MHSNNTSTKWTKGKLAMLKNSIDRTAFDHAQHGQIGKLADDSVYVAYERQLPHPVEKVWRAITDPNELGRWFPGMTLDLKQGGKFKIFFGGECEGPAHISGHVIEFDPPSVLQMGSMRYELQANEAGCLLRFSDILHFDGQRTRQEFAVSVLGGWHAYLDKLELALDGRPVVEDVVELDYSMIKVPGWEVL
jgi:uncharacterized protein YndB with AHSA1/START domain